MALRYNSEEIGVHLLIVENLSCYLAYAVKFLKHQHKLFCLRIGLGVFWCLMLLVKVQVVAEV